MTDFLTINGDAYPVQSDGAAERAPEYRGSRERAFYGNMLSTRTSRARNWEFTLGPLTLAQYDTLVADTQNDAIIEVGGAAIAGGAVDCMVDVLDAPYARDGVLHKRVVHIAVTEVEPA